MNILKRNAILDDIQKRDLSSIFQAWIDAERFDHDPLKRNGLSIVLSEALHERTPSPELLAQMRAFIYDPANSMLERGMLMSALGYAERKETLDMLLDMVPHPPDKKLFASLLSSIGDAASNRNESLSPIYERVWREAGPGDKDLLSAIAASMARLGTASSMEMLLTAAFASDGADDLRKQTARYGLEAANILNEKAVPPLAARLSNDAPLNEASQLAGGILFKMQGAVANRALLAWMQNANERAAPIALNLATNGQNPEIWQAALDAAVPFRSERIRDAIRAGLAEHHKNYP